MTKPKNYRLNDLRLDNESQELLNKVADHLRMRNTDLARYILLDWLKKAIGNGLDNLKIAIITEK